MRLLLLTVFACTVVAACHSTTVAPETTTKSRRLRGFEPMKLGESEWNSYLAVMSGKERKEFHAITSEAERERFLLRHGVDLRRDMQARLRVGMSKDAVDDALEGAADTREWQANRLYFTAYNGTARTHFYCLFSTPERKGDTPELVAYGSYTDQQRAEDAKLLALSAVFQHRLDRVLKPGMGAQELTGMYAKAVAQLKEVRQGVDAYKGEVGQYVGWHAPSAGDYAVEAEWLRANALVDFYEVVNRKPDYRRVEGTTEYWYHVVRPHDDDERYLVIEYRLRDGRMHSWFVYHTDFLGFGEFK